MCALSIVQRSVRCIFVNRHYVLHLIVIIQNIRAEKHTRNSFSEILSLQMRENISALKWNKRKCLPHNLEWSQRSLFTSIAEILVIVVCELLDNKPLMILWTHEIDIPREFVNVWFMPIEKSISSIPFFLPCSTACKSGQPFLLLFHFHDKTDKRS